MQIFISIFAIVLISIIFYFLAKIFYEHIIAPKIREKTIESVREKKHIIKAYLHKVVKREGKDHNTKYKIVYKYKYKGKSYKYKFYGSLSQPENILLYFKKFPRFAVPEEDITDLGHEKIYILITCIVIATAIWLLFFYRMLFT